MRTIVSVSDKTNLVDFARGLADLGVEIYATGGTLDALLKAEVPSDSITKLTGFPEILDGRVKTLHPAIHAGLLARRDVPEQMAQLASLKIGPIDMVVVNLYPFRQTIERPDVTFEQAIENIDIGGPTLLRAAAKNHQHVLVVVDPRDYQPVLEGLRAGCITAEQRRDLAAKAFQHTAFYDTHVAGYLRDESDLFPESLTVALERKQILRYGENPHQQAALYAQTPSAGQAASLLQARQIQGKELSFNNILDLDAALNCVRDFAKTSAVIVKHGNPCGLACGDDLAETYRRARDGDPLSAFGGCVGLNQAVNAATAEQIVQTFYEGVIAPGYSADALSILAQKSGLRVLEVEFEALASAVTSINLTLSLDFKRVGGGFLVQSSDNHAEDDATYQTVTDRHPTPAELADLAFAWRAVKHVKSNAIVLASGLAAVGIGAGQMSRVDSVQIAVRKSGGRSAGSVMASDAFFPWPDGIEAAADAGVTAVIQPGGSIRDDDVIRAANRHHLAMIFTGQRHFRH